MAVEAEGATHRAAWTQRFAALAAILAFTRRSNLQDTRVAAVRRAAFARGRHATGPEHGIHARACGLEPTFLFLFLPVLFRRVLSSRGSDFCRYADRLPLAGVPRDFLRPGGAGSRHTQ